MTVEILKRKNWNEAEKCYEVRLDDSTRRRAFWCDWSGARPVWVVQKVDNEDNQIGDADFYANKRCFPSYL